MSLCSRSLSAIVLPHLENCNFQTECNFCEQAFTIFLKRSIVQKECYKLVILNQLCSATVICTVFTVFSTVHKKKVWRVAGLTRLAKFVVWAGESLTNRCCLVDGNSSIYCYIQSPSTQSLPVLQQNCEKSCAEPMEDLRDPAASSQRWDRSDCRHSKRFPCSLNWQRVARSHSDDLGGAFGVACQLLKQLYVLSFQ